MLEEQSISISKKFCKGIYSDLDLEMLEWLTVILPVFQVVYTVHETRLRVEKLVFHSVFIILFY
jgi:hypothetical protein